MTAATDPIRRIGRAGGNDGVDRLFRFIAWANLFCLGVFVFETWLTLIVGVPGPGEALAGGGDIRAWLLLLLYPAGIAAAAVMVFRTPVIGLREDADRITDFNAWVIRGAFFAVLYVGLDYTAVDVGLRRAGLTLDPAGWQGLQVMEHAAYRALNGRLRS